MRHSLSIALCLLSVSVAGPATLGCDRSSGDGPGPATPGSETAAKTTAQAPGPKTSSAGGLAPAAMDLSDLPMPLRYAEPLPRIRHRLEGRRVGEIMLRRDGEPVEGVLHGVGLNMCQTGWVLQGYFSVEGGAIEPTTPFLIQLDELPTGRTVRYDDPKIEGSYLRLDLEEASWDRLAGALAIVERDGGEEVFEMKFDGPPSGIATGPGLGAQGCYLTGYWAARLAGEDGALRGMALGIKRPRNTYDVMLIFDDRHALGVTMRLGRNQRVPGNLIRAPLERILRDPSQFPLRVLYRERESREIEGDRLAPNPPLWEGTPVASGQLYAGFSKARDTGPVRIHMEDIPLPDDWPEPLGGQTIERLRAEVMFVTEASGKRIPAPGPPQWWRRPEESELGRDDAARGTSEALGERGN